MLVSIIVTNHNYGAFLAEAIDSALRQSHEDVEVIVVDDGSIDDSRTVLESYQDHATVLLRQNCGQNVSANLGYSVCHGDVVIFLDSDDMLVKDAAKMHVERLSDSCVSKSQGYLRVMDRDSRVSDETIPRKLSPSGEYKELTLKYGTGAIPHTYTSGNAWPRWFLDQVMPLPSDRLSSPDGYLNALSTLFGRTECIDEVVGYYRRHGDNRSKKYFDRESLAIILTKSNDRRDQLAVWAEKLGYDVDLDHWHKWKRSWRDNLIAYVLWLMQGQGPTPSFGELTLSPFKAGRTRIAKATGLCVMLAIIRSSPKTVALALARRLLGFSDQSLGRSGGAPASAQSD